ncbi:MAG TPA: nucleotidyltransferase domain-containing protein [Pseudobdellovibrionaceae bacterium]|nr:nucleotidyltransferase domain-containing protein [Pseudobdellovibrionaceae bacterium]
MSLAKLKDVNRRDPYFLNLLKKIVSRIIDVDKNARIYIFGSFVVDRFTAESDLDIAVIVPDHWSSRVFIEKIYEVGFLSSWPLDLLVFKEKDFAIKKEVGGVCVDIAESGVELYPQWRLDESFDKKI